MYLGQNKKAWPCHNKERKKKKRLDIWPSDNKNHFIPKL
jgi:hypothetical protein